MVEFDDEPIISGVKEESRLGCTDTVEEKPISEPFLTPSSPTDAQVVVSDKLDESANKVENLLEPV